MSEKAHERYKWIKRQVELDEEYLHLMERLRENEPAVHCYEFTLGSGESVVPTVREGQ